MSGSQTPPDVSGTGASDGSQAGGRRSKIRHGIAGAGTPPPELYELPRAEDRISFVYFEHARIDREDNAITAVDQRGTIAVPAAQLSVVLLGPGTTLTQAAMAVIGRNGATVVWVGEHGVRFYASGSALTHSASLLERQAYLVSHRQTRLAVARRMYEMRFPGQDFSRLTMRQLRGMEGARMRRVYRQMSRETGVAWEKRQYNPLDFDDSDQINRALSVANTCLYGVCHAIIVALGCSPGLGFIHVGHELSFVYDIADLYKTEITIPVAFHAVARQPDDLDSDVRKTMRDRFYDVSFLERVAGDIRRLLGFRKGDAGLQVASDASGQDADRGSFRDEGDFDDNLRLWDPRGNVAAGKSYGQMSDGDDAVF